MKGFMRVGRLLLQPFADNGVFFVTMYVLGVLCSLLTMPPGDGAKLYSNLWLELFLDLYVTCVVLSLLPQKVRLWVRRLMYVVLYSVAITDVFCFWKFGSTITPSMLLLVGETDSREAGEFFTTYINLDVVLSPIGWLVLLMLIHAIIALRKKLCRLFKLNYSQLVKPFFTKISAFADRYRITHVSAVAIVVLLVWSVCSSWQNKKGMTRLMTASTIGEVEHILTEANHGEFYLPIYRLAFSIYSNELASKQVGRCIVASNNAKVDSCNYRSPNIVLIIGESYSRSHCQLYGYDVKDTPRQRKLERRGLLTKFDDVVSCWNLTSFVFKNVLSMHVVGEKGEWCDYPLFPELFRKAGYKVTFLTNQFLPEAKQAVYDFSGGFFLNNPTLSKAQFDVRNTQLHPFDDGLLADYDRFLKDGKIDLKGHNLIIFHLIGQHVSYNTRFPRDRRKFTADDYTERRPDIGNGRRRMIANYDNACLYNDSIVDQIVKRFANKNAIVIYMPDHGEEIYEPGRNIVCRNHSAEVDWPLAHYEFEVPFWIYCSHRYALAHPQVFKAIKDAKGKRFMTDALPHMLVWLAGISTKSYHPQYNLLSPDYNEMRPRILKGTADYDKLRNQAMKEKDENNKGK